MAFLDYFPTTAAVDPNTGIRLQNVTAEVFDITDTAFATPLGLTDLQGVSLGTTLDASDDGFFPDFRAAGHTQVIAVSGVHKTPLLSLGALVLSLLPDPTGQDDGLRVATQDGEYVLTDTGDSGVPNPSTGTPGEALVVGDDGTSLVYSPIAAGGTPDWDAVVNKPATFSPSPHTHAAGEINNATTLGRTLITATDPPAARAALFAAPATTVSFPGFGTTATTAAPGNHAHPAATVPFTPTSALNATNVQAAIEEAATLGGVGGVADWDTLVDKPATFPPSTHSHSASEITNSSIVGRSVLTAVDAQTARAAIGAGTGNGTSNLALGTTATTAAPGNHGHNASALNFTPAVGITATNVQAAIEQAAQTGGSGVATTTTLYVKYASGQYPALPTTKPAGVQLVLFKGPVQPTPANVVGGIPTYLGDGSLQIMADYEYRNLS